MSATAAALAPAPSPPPARPRPAAGRRPRRRTSRPPWIWVAMLLACLASVPLGALAGGAHDATAAAPTAPVIEDGPAGGELPMRVAVNVAHSERSGPIVELDDRSVARGRPNAGSLEHGVRLPVRGVGYYTYNPATQEPPGGADRRWGTSMLVSQVSALGEWWDRTHPGAPRLGIGDLSRERGGPFTGPVVGHSSHQNGLDVDIRLPRRDGAEGPANPGNYDRALTQRIVDRLIAQGAVLVLIGPRLDLRGPPGVVVRWPGHDDHLHARFADPDGTGN